MSSSGCNALFPLPGYELLNSSLPLCTPLSMRSDIKPQLIYVTIFEILIVGVSFGLLTQSVIIIGNNVYWLPKFSPQEKLNYLCYLASICSLFELCNFFGWTWEGPWASILESTAAGLANAFGLVAGLSWLSALNDFVDDLKLSNYRSSRKNCISFTAWKLVLVLNGCVSGACAYFIPSLTIPIRAFGRILYGAFFVVPVVWQSLLVIRKGIMEFADKSRRLQNLSRRLLQLTIIASLIALIEIVFFLQDALNLLKGSSTSTTVTIPTSFPWSSLLLAWVRVFTVYIIWYICRPVVAHHVSRMRQVVGVIASVWNTIVFVFCILIIALARWFPTYIGVLTQVVLLIGAAGSACSLLLADRTTKQELEAVVKYVEVQVSTGFMTHVRFANFFGSTYTPIFMDFVYLASIAFSSYNRWGDLVSSSTEIVLSILLPDLRKLATGGSTSPEVRNSPFYLVCSSFAVMGVVQFLMRTGIVRFNNSMKMIVATICAQLYGTFFMSALSVLLTSITCDSNNELLSGRISCNGSFGHVSFSVFMALYAVYFGLGVGVLFLGFAANRMANPQVRYIPFAVGVQATLKYVIVLILHWDLGAARDSPQEFGTSLLKNICINILIFSLFYMNIKTQPCLGVQAVTINNIRNSVYAHSVLINLCSFLNLIIAYATQTSPASSLLLIPWITYAVLVIPTVIGTFFWNMRRAVAGRTDMYEMIAEVKETPPSDLIRNEKNHYESSQSNLVNVDGRKASLALFTRRDVQILIKEVLDGKNTSENINDVIYFLHNARTETVGRQAIKRLGFIPSLVSLTRKNYLVVDILTALCEHSQFYRDEVVKVRGIEETCVAWNAIGQDAFNETVHGLVVPEAVNLNIKHMGGGQSGTHGHNLSTTTHSIDITGSRRKSIEDSSIKVSVLPDINLNPVSLFFSGHHDPNKYSTTSPAPRTSLALLSPEALITIRKAKLCLEYLRSLKMEGKHWLMEIDILPVSEGRVEKITELEMNAFLDEVSMNDGGRRLNRHQRNKSGVVSGEMPSGLLASVNWGRRLTSDNPQSTRSGSSTVDRSAPSSPAVTSGKFNRVTQVSIENTFLLRRFDNLHHSIAEPFNVLIDACILICLTPRPLGIKSQETDVWDTNLAQQVNVALRNKKSTAPLLIGIDARPRPDSITVDSDFVAIHHELHKIEHSILDVSPLCPLVLIVNIDENETIGTDGVKDNEVDGKRKAMLNKVKHYIYRMSDAATVLLNQNSMTGKVLQSYGITNPDAATTDGSFRGSSKHMTLSKQDSIFKLNAAALSRKLQRNIGDGKRFARSPIPLIANADEVVMSDEEKQEGSLAPLQIVIPSHIIEKSASGKLSIELIKM